MILYYLKNFNNYYNRMIKRCSTIQEYISSSDDYAIRGDSSEPLLGGKGPVNFNINDGVTSTITYNYDPQQTWQPDYVVCVDSDDETILHTWFVLEAQRTRKGQYHITCRRDIINDNFEAIKESPIFVEKAMLPDSDMMIFNKENIDFNQIKKSETLLKDKTGCSWIVGYMTEPGQDEAVSGILPSYYDILRTYITDYEYVNYCKISGYKPSANAFYSRNIGSWTFLTVSLQFRGMTLGTVVTSGTINLYFKESSTGYTFDSYDTNNTVGYSNFVVKPTTNKSCTEWSSSNASKIRSIGGWIQTYLNLDKSNIMSKEETYTVSSSSYVLHTKSEYNDFIRQEGKIIYATSEVSGVAPAGYYTVGEPLKQQNWALQNHKIEVGTDYYTALDNAIGDITSYSGVTVEKWTTNTQYLIYDRTVSTAVGNMTVSDSFVSSTIRKDGPVSLIDAPYRMFAIPYILNPKADDNLTITTASSSFNVNFDAGIMIAQSISKKGSGDSGWLKDLQLLPYCPFIQSSYISNKNINISNLTNPGNYEFIKNGSGDNVSIIFWCDKSNFSLDISYNFDITEPKIQNQTDNWRLCSPNYNGLFDFNAAQNNGGLSVNVDCTYKPYQPYIKVNPMFNNDFLFGGDYDDYRGLICAGDFSLPQTTDAWATYVRNNVNYQNTFNRDIQNLEMTQDIAMKQMKWNVVSGVVGAGLQGGTTGASMGGGAGAAAGAVAASTLSAIGGAMDIKYQEQLNQEAINYRQDQFGYSLGNIKALPNGLSKVSAFTYNNKVFPFIEYYSCTDIEKQAFRDKIKYNGMTVGRIDTIDNIINNGMYTDYRYIKGKIIRIQNSGDDFHGANAIAEELDKGVFIKQ